ncbi:MAG: hypothetical protein MZV64_24420 [Ignavibacteriales bacterium]|nr:hypothetical protein [Ignavibacteriales bacterium]
MHSKNSGVGGAVKTGYRKALEGHAGLIVKLDGDGQMNPLLIPKLRRTDKKQAVRLCKGQPVP